MPEDFKGLNELYDTILSAFSDSKRGHVKFYEWTVSFGFCQLSKC